MSDPKEHHVVHPESEDRGAQAGELRRRRRRGRIAAGDEGIGPNPDAHPVEETVENDPGSNGSLKNKLVTGA
jgi:hypothetical protein